MVTDQEATPRTAMPQRPPVTLMRSSKDEEGPVKGEIWAVLRAFAFLIGFIALVGFLIA